MAILALVVEKYNNREQVLKQESKDMNIRAFEKILS